MAKKSKIEREERLRRTAAKYAKVRAELRAVARDPERSDEEKWDARLKLQRLPRDANPIRIHNRCSLTGRPRAYYRKFGISRIAFRELAHRGEIPGVRKSSW